MLPKQIGKYESSAELGHGEMATVYRARDPDRHRDVAVKVLRREHLTDLGFRDTVYKHLPQKHLPAHTRQDLSFEGPRRPPSHF